MSQRGENHIGKDCLQHRLLCNMVCTYPKCPAGQILCEKCVHDHTNIHQKQLIYHIDNLSEIHGFNKVSKMKDILVANKLAEEAKLAEMYRNFSGLLDPLLKRAHRFEKQSQELISEKLTTYLSKNKAIINSTVIQKSDPVFLKKNPALMLEEVLAQMEIINEKEALLKENADGYAWYSEATAEMCKSLKEEITSMVNVGIKVYDNYFGMQKSQYDENAKVHREHHHDESFVKRYAASHKVADRNDKHSLEMEIIRNRKEVTKKDEEIKRAQREIKEKVLKIEELQAKMEGLKEELMQWEQKLEREEREKAETESREKRKKEEYLIKNDIIIDEGRSISVEKKAIEDKYFHLIFETVPNPIHLILNNHQLTPSQLDAFLAFSSVQVLTMNFMKCNMDFLTAALKKYTSLHTLELNSSGLRDEMLGDIGHYFCSRVRHISIMDNNISDNGLELMFKNMRQPLESLYVSYNRLTFNSIDVINRYSYEIRTLHISKNPMIKTKGGILIGKHLKEIEELFVGGTGIQKEGFLAICRNCSKLKRLSLVGTDLSTDIVSEVLLALQRLEWLDISYTPLTKDDLEKVEKLKIFNKGIEIVSHL